MLPALSNIALHSITLFICLIFNGISFLFRFSHPLILKGLKIPVANLSSWLWWDWCLFKLNWIHPNFKQIFLKFQLCIGLTYLMPHYMIKSGFIPLIKFVRKFCFLLVYHYFYHFALSVCIHSSIAIQWHQ